MSSFDFYFLLSFVKADLREKEQCVAEDIFVFFLTTLDFNIIFIFSLSPSPPHYHFYFAEPGLEMASCMLGKCSTTKLFLQSFSPTLKTMLLICWIWVWILQDFINHFESREIFFFFLDWVAAQGVEFCLSQTRPWVSILYTFFSSKPLPF